MKLLFENWRGYLNEEQEGEGILLYHATCSPPESFIEGIDVNRAAGYGQGHILSGNQKQVPCPGDPIVAYIVVSDEPVTPENFDIDYEVYAKGFAKFMIKKIDYFSNNMEVFNMEPPRVSTRRTPQEYLIQSPHQFKFGESFTIRLLYLAAGSDTNIKEAAALSKIAKKLAEVDPNMFKKFEEEFLSQASAVKYNGEKIIYPLRIEDLEGNVIWSRNK